MLALSSRMMCLSLLCPLVCLAQPSATGGVDGTVQDSAGGVVPEVRVVLTHKESGALRRANSDATGRFRFRALAAGEYVLRLEKEGFAAVESEEFAVSVGQILVHRIEMRPAELVQRLEVSERPEALDTAAATASVGLGGERIEESPAANRNFLSFVLVAPGVTASSGSNAQRSRAIARAPLSDSGFSFTGLRGRNNGMSVDGADNRDETTGGSRVAIGLEMVQEFRVSGSVVGAEAGGAAGGLVNVVTRSGGNLWHGDVTYFTQHERLNASNSEASGAKQRFRRFQPGVSLNGPAKRDKTFFATALEQEWSSGEEWSEAPASAVDPINRALAGPLFANAGTKSVAAGLFPTVARDTEFSFKGNHYINEGHSFSARYAFSRGRTANDVQGTGNFTERSARGSSLTRDHSLVGWWIAVPGPRLTSDLRAQFGERSAELSPNSQGALLEIPGVLSLGQALRLESERRERHYQVVEGISLAARSHQLSLGASVHLVRLNARLADRFGGAFLFPTLGDFLRGTPDVFFQAFGDPRTSLTTSPWGAWLHDRWQARTGLTLEAGVRFDRQRMPAGLPSSGNNLSPRLGLAWRPKGTADWVFRAGFGLFYDRYPLAWLNEAVQKDGRRGFEQYAAGAEAARAFAAARGGSLRAPLAGLAPSIYKPDASLPSTYAAKLTAGVERAFGKDTTLTLEYFGVRGLHLPRLRNAALGLPAVYRLEQAARSAYQGVSISLHRRLSREWTYLLGYTLGRTLDDASDFDEHPMDPADVRRDWGPSGQDQRHRLAASALFELPEEEISALPGPLGEALENVIVAPIFTVGSGRPINALATSDLFRTGAYPISARPEGLPRNPFLSPGSVSFDLRVMKGFPVRDNRAILQVGVEAFNILNHFNPLRVSPYYAAPGGRLSSYGRAIETLPARQIQLLVQFEY